MISRLRQYATTIIGAFFTIGLTLISDFVLKLDQSTTWLTFVIGSLLTLTATLLELRVIDIISTEVSHKLEIYKLLSQIEDPELQQLANDAIVDCIRKLQNYQQGFMPLSVHNRYTNRVSNCQRSLKAVLWAQDIQEIDKLIYGVGLGRNYYKGNIDAQKRGVQVKRIFIIDKNNVLDSKGFFSDLETFKKLDMHRKDGLITQIAWLDDWYNVEGKSDLFRDFVIFDDSEVMVQSYDIGNKTRGSTLIKDSVHVKDYRRFFQILETISCSFDEVITRHPPTSN